jgi:multisubunit Na+/H+ antiporter MnhG subunit
VGVYTLLQRLWSAAATRPWASFAAIIAAMLCGKVVYYALKALVIAPAVLVTTPVATQAIVALVAAALFCSVQYLTTRGK